MTRPIVWAIGTLVATALTATAAKDRLVARFAGGAPRAEPASSVASAPRPGEAGPKESILTLAGDLRGHFVAHPAVDGRRVRMLVDTGASYVALSWEDAAMIGLKLEPRDFTLRMSTANGIASGAPVRLAEIRLGDITVRNVEAVVAQRGAMRTSLLGMSFLRRLNGFEVSKGRLTLRG